MNIDRYTWIYIDKNRNKSILKDTTYYWQVLIDNYIY